MKNRGLIVLVVFAVLGGVLYWRSQRKSDAPATSTATQPTGSATPTPTVRAAAVDLARLAVTVTDGKAPIVDALVRIAPDDGDVVVVLTGADGVAHATGLPAGRCAISASAPDHAPAGIAKTELEAGRESAVSLVLVAGGRSLTGVVTDASSGPISGARIDAAKLDGRTRAGDEVATTFTGLDGHYKLTVAEGQLIVAVASADYSPQSRYVDVGASGAVANFALVPGGVIEGVVRDDKTKQPVAGAQVEANRDTAATVLAEPHRHRIVAGPDGKFRFAGLRPGAYELSAHAESRFTKAATIVGLGVAEQVGDVEILVGVGPVIRGRVVDEHGAAAPDAKVRAESEHFGTEAKADASGAFVLDGLRPGDYELAGSGQDYVGDITPVKLADHDVDNVIVTVRRGITLTGHVEPRQVCDVHFDLDQVELGRGATPLLMSATTTDADGAFTFSPLSPLKARLAARCPSGEQGSVPVDVKPGMAEVVIDVKPGASIAGRVIDGDGKPFAGITVMADPEDHGQHTMIVNGMVTSGVQSLTTAAGTFELTGLAPGTYKLGALDRGKPLRNHKAPPRVVISAAEKKTGVELVVDRPNGVIKGVITGPDGSPIADAWVTVTQDLASMLAGVADRAGDGGGTVSSSTVMIESSDDGPGGGGGAAEFPPALTDAQGHYEIGGLPHAIYTVIAEAQAGKLRGRTADVTPDATTDIKLLGLTALSGTVHGPNGPTTLFSVALDGPSHDQRSFTDGVFEFARLDAGDYKVTVQSSDGNGEAAVKIVPGQPATVDIALVANAVIIGTIVDGAGHPQAGVPLVVIPDTGSGRTQISMTGPPQVSGPDGKFRLETHAGKSILAVITQPAPIMRRGLELEAGKTLDVGTISTAGAPANP